MSEQALVTAKASVMVYNDVDKKWVPGGSSPGVSKVNIYHHSVNNAFRVVGRKLQDLEVVVNCSIFNGLKYNQATPTFHQWRDNRQVYGLNFISKEDADRFAVAMFTALDTLAVNPVQHTLPTPSPQPMTMSQTTQPTYQRPAEQGSVPVVSQNGHPEKREEMRLGQPPSRDEYRAHHRQSSADKILLDQSNIMMKPTSVQDTTLTRQTRPGENCVTNQGPTYENTTSVHLGDAIIPVAPPPPPVAPPPPAAPPLPSYATSSRPRTAPAVPSKSGQTPNFQSTAGSPPAPQLLTPAVAPPPPPALLPSVGGDGINEQSGGKSSGIPPPLTNLAAALKNAQLRKVSKTEIRERDEGVTPHYAPPGIALGRSVSLCTPNNTDIMSEMARKLKDRRAKADGMQSGTDDVKAFDDLSSSCAGVVGSRLTAAENVAADSPRTDRTRRFQSLTGQETFHTIHHSGSGVGNAVPSTLTTGCRPATVADLEALKHDIIAEMRRELQAAKQEIIDVIRSEMG